MKSFLVTLLSWAVLYLGIEFFFRQRFYPPGDWIGALLVSFFMALGIGALRKARIDGRDADLMTRPEGPPRDGERVAIAGTIEPIDATLVAPFSGCECVAYDYEATHFKQRGKSNDEVIDRSGLGLAPSVIRSGVRTIKLLAFPSMEDFKSEVNDDAFRERAKSFLKANAGEDKTGLFTIASLGDIADLLRDQSGAIRKDWRLTDHHDLEHSFFSERALPPRTKVCVVGRYSAEKNAVVPEANRGGVRLIKGTRAEALKFMREKRTGDFISAGCLLILPALIAMGVLMYREHYAEANGQPSLRGNAMAAVVAAGDVAGVRSALKRGADPNFRDADGRPALMLAPNVATVAVLLDAGAKVDDAGRGNVTRLMDAARFGYDDIAQLLLQHGAAVNERSDYYRKTALDFALAGGHRKVAEILREAGAEYSPITSDNGEPLPAGNSEQWRLCTEYFAAARARDTTTLLSLSPIATRIRFAKDVAPHLDAMALAAPLNPLPISGFVRDDLATVTVHGASARGKDAPWIVQMVREDGSWRVADAHSQTLEPTR
jgi:uncharacterized protein